LCVDTEPVGNVSQRQSGRVELGRLGEDLVVPCRLFAVARDTAAVQVAGDGGSVDAELDGESADGGACLIGLDEVDDGGRGEASLGRV
jgi:hypothetical protein